MITHIAIFVSVFFVMLGVVQVLPEVLASKIWERYQLSSRRTARELDKFFLNVKPIKIMIGAAVLGALLGALTGSWVMAVAVLAAGAFAPKLILAIWKDIRSTQFEAQLMDALLLMGNSLKSGLDVVSGIERIAATMKPPISEEFGLVLNAYRLGAPLESALIELTERINSRTLETVVQALTLQRETGGNIIRTFDQLIVSIREESKLQNKVRAITSQGRTQIFFLSGFPWALAALFFVIAPEFMQPALANSWGQLVLLFLVVWEIVGIVVTKKIVAVDV